MVLRVVQAFGGSALYSLGVGTVADIFEPKQRGRAISYYSLGPQLGPILGPAIGGAIAQRSTWRWTFGFLGKDDGGPKFSITCQVFLER